MPEFPGRLRTPRQATAPASPAVGELWYDVGTNTLFYWNNTTWVSGGGGSTTVNAAVARMNAAGGSNLLFDGWAAAPLPSSASWTIEPAGAFVIDTGDNSIRPTAAGWYTFSAGLYSDDTDPTQVFLANSTSSLRAPARSPTPPAPRPIRN